MEYAADDFAAISKRLREITQGAPVFWGIRHDDGTLKCWCYIVDAVIGAAKPFSSVEPSRFSDREKAEKAFAGLTHLNNPSAFSIRELPPEADTQ